MDKRIAARFRTSFILGNIEVLKEGRKAKNGLPMYYFPTLVLVGENAGKTISELARIKGSSAPAMYQLLKRGINKGIIYRDGRKYYLTETGANVYKLLRAKFDELAKSLGLEIVSLKVKRSETFDL